MPFNSRVDQVLQWLQLPDAERPRIITLYMDQPDTNGHAYGPYSAEVTEAMCHVDAAFGHLLDGVEDLGLTDQLNIVLLADHGMAELSQDRVVYLGDYTDTSKLAAYGGSPVQSIFPNEGVDSNDIYNDLVDKHPAMNVYKKTDLPAHMHYEHNRRIGDVVAVGEIGWQIKVDRGDYIGLKGDHGYVYVSVRVCVCVYVSVSFIHSSMCGARSSLQLQREGRVDAPYFHGSRAAVRAWWHLADAHGAYNQQAPVCV
jgi:predicted AlkP superfamily pyrophosphatase or phosphodiesterase